MDPELKKMLGETLRLTEENNHMLHRVRAVQKWLTFWQIFKVLVIVGIALGSFYFLEPYLDQVLNLYSSISGSNTVQDPSDNNSSFQDLFKKF